jgi:hypothetical protein
MTSIIIAAVGGLIALIAAFIGGHVVGGNKKEAVLQPQIDAAKQQTQDVVTKSQVADAEVKQAAADKSAQVDEVIKTIDARVDALPEGDAAKELETKYGADK